MHLHNLISNDAFNSSLLAAFQSNFIGIICVPVTLLIPIINLCWFLVSVPEQREITYQSYFEMFMKVSCYDLIYSLRYNFVKIQDK